MERVVTEPLGEKYRDFGTLKSRIRELLGTDTRLRLLGAPKYNDDKNFFECPEVHQQLYVSDEIDIAIEKAALAGGRSPTRIDFLRRAPRAGRWLVSSNVRRYSAAKIRYGRETGCPTRRISCLQPK